MEFEKIVESFLKEDMTAGGAGSVFGPNVGATATPFSGDNIAKGDSRNVYGLTNGILTRFGMKSPRKKKRKDHKRVSTL